MAFGNMLNLGAYFFLKYFIHRRDPDSLDGQAPPVTPLIMLPVIQGVLFIYSIKVFLLGNSA